MLFDWLVIGQALAVNPAQAVRGPKHVVRRGKTPVPHGLSCHSAWASGAAARQMSNVRYHRLETSESTSRTANDVTVAVTTPGSACSRLIGRAIREIPPPLKHRKIIVDNCGAGH